MPGSIIQRITRSMSVAIQSPSNQINDQKSTLTSISISAFPVLQPRSSATLMLGSTIENTQSLMSTKMLDSSIELSQSLLTSTQMQSSGIQFLQSLSMAMQSHSTQISYQKSRTPTAMPMSILIPVSSDLLPNSSVTSVLGSTIQSSQSLPTSTPMPSSSIQLSQLLLTSSKMQSSYIQLTRSLSIEIQSPRINISDNKLKTLISMLTPVSPVLTPHSSVTSVLGSTILGSQAPSLSITIPRSSIRVNQSASKSMKMQTSGIRLTRSVSPAIQTPSNQINNQKSTSTSILLSISMSASPVLQPPSSATSVLGPTIQSSQSPLTSTQMPDSNIQLSQSLLTSTQMQSSGIQFLQSLSMVMQTHSTQISDQKSRTSKVMPMSIVMPVSSDLLPNSSTTSVVGSTIQSSRSHPISIPSPGSSIQLNQPLFTPSTMQSSDIQLTRSLSMESQRPSIDINDQKKTTSVSMSMPVSPVLTPRSSATPVLGSTILGIQSPSISIAIPGSSIQLNQSLLKSTKMQTSDVRLASSMSLVIQSPSNQISNQKSTSTSTSMSISMSAIPVLQPPSSTTSVLGPTIQSSQSPLTSTQMPDSSIQLSQSLSTSTQMQFSDIQFLQSRSMPMQSHSTQISDQKSRSSTAMPTSILMPVSSDLLTNSLTTSVLVSTIQSSQSLPISIPMIMPAFSIQISQSLLTSSKLQPSGIRISQSLSMDIQNNSNQISDQKSTSISMSIFIPDTPVLTPRSSTTSVLSSAIQSSQSLPISIPIPDSSVQLSQSLSTSKEMLSAGIPVTRSLSRVTQNPSNESNNQKSTLSSLSMSTLMSISPVLTPFSSATSMLGTTIQTSQSPSVSIAILVMLQTNSTQISDQKATSTSVSMRGLFSVSPVQTLRSSATSVHGYTISISMPVSPVLTPRSSATSVLGSTFLGIQSPSISIAIPGSSIQLNQSLLKSTKMQTSDIRLASSMSRTIQSPSNQINNQKSTSTSISMSISMSASPVLQPPSSVTSVLGPTIQSSQSPLTSAQMPDSSIQLSQSQSTLTQMQSFDIKFLQSLSMPMQSRSTQISDQKSRSSTAMPTSTLMPVSSDLLTNSLTTSVLVSTIQSSQSLPISVPMIMPASSIQISQSLLTSSKLQPSGIPISQSLSIDIQNNSNQISDQKSTSISMSIFIPDTPVLTSRSSTTSMLGSAIQSSQSLPISIPIPDSSVQFSQSPSTSKEMLSAGIPVTRSLSRVTQNPSNESNNQKSTLSSLPMSILMSISPVLTLLSSATSMLGTTVQTSQSPSVSIAMPGSAIQHKQSLLTSTKMQTSGIQRTQSPSMVMQTNSSQISDQKATSTSVSMEILFSVSPVQTLRSSATSVHGYTIQSNQSLSMTRSSIQIIQSQLKSTQMTSSRFQLTQSLSLVMKSRSIQIGDDKSRKSTPMLTSVSSVLSPRSSATLVFVSTIQSNQSQSVSMSGSSVQLSQSPLNSTQIQTSSIHLTRSVSTIMESLSIEINDQKSRTSISVSKLMSVSSVLTPHVSATLVLGSTVQSDRLSSISIPMPNSSFQISQSLLTPSKIQPSGSQLTRSLSRVIQSPSNQSNDQKSTSTPIPTSIFISVSPPILTITRSSAASLLGSTIQITQSLSISMPISSSDIQLSRLPLTSAHIKTSSVKLNRSPSIRMKSSGIDDQIRVSSLTTSILMPLSMTVSSLLQRQYNSISTLGFSIPTSQSLATSVLASMPKSDNQLNGSLPLTIQSLSIQFTTSLLLPSPSPLQSSFIRVSSVKTSRTTSVPVSSQSQSVPKPDSSINSRITKSRLILIPSSNIHLKNSPLTSSSPSHPIQSQSSSTRYSLQKMAARSPSQLLGTQTSTTVVPIAQDTMYAVEIVFEQQFVNKLKNLRGEAYAKELTSLLIAVYSNVVGFKAAGFVSFSNGSLDARLIFDSSSTITIEIIKHRLENAIIVIGVSTFQIIAVNVRAIASIPPFSCSLHVSSSTRVFRTTHKSNSIVKLSTSSSSLTNPSSTIASSSSQTTNPTSPTERPTEEDIIPTVKNKLTIKIRIQMAINLEFNEDLETKSSEAFREFDNKIVGYLNKIYSSVPEFVGAKILSFSKGNDVSNEEPISNDESYIYSSASHVQSSQSASLQTINVHLKLSQSTSYKTGVQTTPPFSLLSNTMVSIADSTMVSSPEEDIIPTVKNKLTIKIRIQMAINLEFNKDLETKSSEAFRELDNKIVGYLSKIYSSVPEFVGAKILSFSKGNDVSNEEPISNDESYIYSSASHVQSSQSASLQTISVHLKPSQSTSYKTGVQTTPSFSLLSNTMVSIADSTMVSSPEEDIIPTVKNKLTIKIRIQMAINLEFNEDLETKSSEAFRELDNKIVGYLSKIYSSVPEFCWSQNSIFFERKRCFKRRAHF